MKDGLNKMLIDDIYKIKKSTQAVIIFDRALFPRLIIIGSLMGLSILMMIFMWNDPEWEGYFWFFVFFMVFTTLGFCYSVGRDKQIALEKDRAVFVLTGKGWGRHHKSEYPTDGTMAIQRVSPSDGSLASNKVLEIRLFAGLRFFLGFNSFGSFSEEKLVELAEFLKDKTQGRLKMRPC